ncbi:MAG: lytic transglycosylase domain-containing protein [Betaproteobacteria bacterium]|nr:lytic transglycosylase domain-containing protein [Betaproteobacteria bacterium]
MAFQSTAAIFAALSLLAASGAALPARADIFSFKDERGVVHFTNIPSLDRRYKLVRREAGSAPGPSRSYMPTEADIRRYQAIVESASRHHGVDTALVHAVISAESGYNPNALSRKGASGLMQLMPDTARRYGVQNIFDPVENVHGGVRYLKDLLALFNGDMRLAVAGYNAGENAVIRAGNRIPPYPETQNYVPKVIDFYHRFRARSG